MKRKTDIKACGAALIAPTYRCNITHYCELKAGHTLNADEVEHECECGVVWADLKQKNAKKRQHQ